MRAPEIELLLPEVMRRTVLPDSPMAALVGVMEAMHAPAESALGVPAALTRSPPRTASSTCSRPGSTWRTRRDVGGRPTGPG